MNPKTIFFYLLTGMVIYLTSCAKSDVPSDPNPDPNPNDTIPKDTHTSTSNLIYPTSFIFKNTIIPETEYYQITSTGKTKVNEPYYMRYSKNLLQSSIKDDHGMPYKEFRFISKDKLTIIYKDSTIVENNEYTVKNNKDIFLKTSGYIGSLNADNSIFNINLSPFTYSNDANRPMYARLYLSLSYSPDKNLAISYLVTSQSLFPGDTLAINFAQMVYTKK